MKGDLILLDFIRVKPGILGIKAKWLFVMSGCWGGKASAVSLGWKHSRDVHDAICGDNRGDGTEKRAKGGTCTSLKIVWAWQSVG